MRTEPWVGTWRPHKPKGPIAALYGSPGPKYALPGLTGRQYSPDHSEKLTFRSAPVTFVFGVVCLHYECQSPATYSLPPVMGTKTAVASSAPSFSISGRCKTGTFYEDLKKTPGPAAYKAVDPCISGRKPPQFSMTGRNFTPSEATGKPGPGAYYPEQVRNLIIFTFGLRHSQYIAPITVDAEYCHL
uniref:Tripartite motif containing 35-30 n=1 Tax=Amphilophus citrinellus TaxID=61819 RepID=A0A3Q0QTE6_AMPCI